MNGGQSQQRSAIAGIIVDFSGEHSFLSNYWPSPIRWEGDDYPTVEHAYQAAKCLDPVARGGIRDAPTPGDARRLGREVSLRPGWQRQRFHVMRQLLEVKFTSDPELRAKLLATEGAVLVEGNTWGDTYWGTCNGRGANHLGRLLMDLREQLASEELPVAKE